MVADLGADAVDGGVISVGIPHGKPMQSLATPGVTIARDMGTWPGIAHRGKARVAEKERATEMGKEDQAISRKVDRRGSRARGRRKEGIREAKGGPKVDLRGLGIIPLQVPAIRGYAGTVRGSGINKMNARCGRVRM